MARYTFVALALLGMLALAAAEVNTAAKGHYIGSYAY